MIAVYRSPFVQFFVLAVTTVCGVHSAPFISHAHPIFRMIARGLHRVEPMQKTLAPTRNASTRSAYTPING